LLKRLDTIPPVTVVEVAAVDLASFDQLCTEMRSAFFSIPHYSKPKKGEILKGLRAGDPIAARL
jgi:hypothetical protein